MCDPGKQLPPSSERAGSFVPAVPEADGEGGLVEYVVVMHTAEEGGYWAEVPALDGCFAQAETIEELLEESRSAIVAHLEALTAEGQAPPEPSTILVATVRVPERAAA